MTRLELAKKRAKELEKTQSNVTNKENTQSTSNTSKSTERLELAKQRANELESAYKKAQEKQQAWNEYVEKNGVDKINSDYSKYMQSVTSKIAPKLSQTDSVQDILSKKNVITPSEMQDASEALTAYKTKKGIEEDKTSNEDNEKKTVEYDDSLTKFQENDFKLFQKTRKTAQDKGWTNTKNPFKTAVAGYTGLEKEKQEGTLFKMPENLKDNLRYFEDGYQFGDLTKSSFETQKELTKDLLSTGVEGTIDIGKGTLSVSENLANAGASAIAFGADLIGQDDFANALRKQVAKGSPFTSLDNVINDATEWYNKNSFTGDLLDSANEGIGQTFGQLAVGEALLGAGNVPIKFGKHILNIPTTAFLTGLGSSASETYAEAEQQLNGIENATWREKAQMALRTIRGGIIEGVTEGMFGMLGVGGSDITDEWAKKAMAQATSSYEKQLIKVLYAGGGEAVEEFVSYSANWLFDNGFINKLGNLDLTQDYNWDEVFEEMASAFISSGISQSGTSITQINQATKNAISEAEQMIGRELTAKEKTEIKNNITDIVLEAKEELEETVKMYPAKQSEIDYANIEKTVNKNNEYLRNKYGVKINEENVLFQKPELSNFERLKQKFQIKHDNYDKPIVQSKSNNVQKTNKNVQKQTKNAQKQAKNVQGTSDNVQNVSDNTSNNVQNASDNTQTLTNTAKSFQDIIKSNSTIQGLEDYSEQDVKNIVSDHVEDLYSEAKIKNIKINEKQDTNQALNVTIEYDGNISQEELNSILNQDPLVVDGVKININAEDLNVFEENKGYNSNNVYSDSFAKNDFIEQEFNNQETVLSDFTKRAIIETVVDDIENYVQNKEKITNAELNKYIEHLDDNASPNAELESYYREDVETEDFNAWKEAKKIYKNTINSALKELGYEYNNKENAFVKHNELSTNNTKEISKIYNEFNLASKNIDRSIVVAIANDLNVPISHNGQKIETDMKEKAGHNQQPKIIEITKLFEDVTDKNAKEYRNQALEKALELFRNTETLIKDTDSTVEIKFSGIDKTFSGKVTESKIQSADNIKDIIEEGIYLYSTKNIHDENGIVYHHFFAPINYNNSNGLMRVVIKEYINDRTLKDRYYYHQLEYIDTNKKDTNSALPRKIESKDGELVSYVDNSISKNKSVVNNQYMQSDKNNVKNSEQSSFSLSEKQDTVEDNSQDYEYTNEKEKLHIERAEEIFGYTDDFEKAGYLTWNGELLDFSDGSDRRIEDHRAINQVFDETFDSNSDYLIKFMNEGNIRINPETPGLEISNFTEPSNAQLDMIEEYAAWNKYGGYFVVDFCNKYGDNIGSLEYENNINPSQIIDDINEFFRTGELPNVEETNKQYDNQITIEDTLRTKMYYKSNGNKPVVVAQRYWNGFEKKGYIDLNGKTVRDAQDVAELSQIFRNPQYETARMIYVKGDTIVGQEAVSSHLPNSSAISTEQNRSKAFYKIEDRMKRLNADGYYMVHNHPSGVAKASQQDINLTKTVSSNIKGFKGHIIVDHGTYAYISKGIDGNITYRNELKVDDKNALYKGSTFETALPTDKVPWSEKINSREDFASLMYNLKNSPNYSSLILSDTDNKINAIIDIPNGFFNMRANHVEGYIKNVAKQYGAVKAFVGTSDSNVFEKLKGISNLQDAILYKNNKQQFAEATDSNLIFNPSKQAVAVRIAEETKDERIERVRKYIEEFQQGMGTLGVKVNRKDIINRIIEDYGITTKGNSKELDKVSTEIQKLFEDGALTDKKIEGYAEYLIDNLKVTVDDFYSANKELKELIRQTKLYASDTVKNGFGSWNDFRKNNMGTLRLTNDENALPIDTFYKELTEVYGEEFFPSDISNISDQLERISEVAKQIKEIEQTLRENIQENFGEDAIKEIQNGLTQNLKTWRDKMAQESSENTDENSKPDKIKKRSYTATLRGNEMVDKFLNIEDMDYAVMRNQKALNEANNILDTKGYEKALNYFESVIESHKIASASDVVLGERLIQETIKMGDWEKAMELVSDVTILGTELGQAVQAMSVISRLTPAGQLMHLKRVVKKLSEEIERKTPKKKRQKNSNTQNTQGTIENFAEIVSSDENKMPKEIRDNSKLKNMVDTIVDGEQAKMELPQEIADNDEFKTAMNEIVTGKTNDNSKLKSIVEKLSDEIVTGEQTRADLPKNEYDNSKLMELTNKVIEGEQSKIELKQEMKDNAKLEKIVTEVVEGEQGKLELGATDEALDAVEEFKGLEITPEMEMEILSAKTPEELKMAMTRVKEQLASQMPVGWTEKLSSWRYLSMLGNPKTHIRNILGNLVMTTTLYQGKNFIQRAVETVFDSKLEERTRTFKKSTDEVKYFAEKMLEENAETLTGSGYANIQSEIKDMRKIFKIGLLNKISELNSNALSKEDFWFKAPIFKSALAEYLTANGIKTEQDIKQNKEVVQKGISFAIDEALKATFNQYNKLASAISQLENNSALGRVFVGGLAPFKKTPLNIVKTSWQYSPLGLLETVTLQTHNLRNGLINANEYIERISQGLTGSAVTLVGMWLASMELLTGSSGSGKEDEYKESLGMFAPYSIHLPEREIFGIHLDEKFVDISWLAPSAVPLLVGAEIYDAIANNKEKDVLKTVDDIIKILEKTMNPISNMTMLSTFNDALINYGGNDDTSGLEAILSTVIKSYIGQFFPTLGYQINKIIDPTIRSTKASKNSSFKKGEQIVRQNANKIPFTSLLLEPSTDIWGNVRKRSDNFVVRAVDSLFNPASVEKPSATGVDEKILKLYGVNKNNEILPSIPRDSFTVNSETYEMSASEYTQYKMTYGQTAYKKLKTLFSTSEYRQMSNEEKEKAIAEVYEMSKKLAQYEYMTAKYGKTKAMSRLLNDKELKKYNEANKLGLNYEKYLEAYYSQKSVEGEKDKKGNTIKNSKKENQIEAIQKALNTTEEKAKKLQAIFEGKYEEES